MECVLREVENGRGAYHLEEDVYVFHGRLFGDAEGEPVDVEGGSSGRVQVDVHGGGQQRRQAVLVSLLLLLLLLLLLMLLWRRQAWLW